MYLITNRNLNAGAKSFDVFGKTPNPEGPNELRLCEVTRAGGKWKVGVLDDALSREEVKALKRQYRLDIDIERDWYASLKVACALFELARAEKRAILFFVHGYNNDVEDVINAAHEIERLYNVIVVPFTWPANGGGKVSGAAAYLSDKADARASAGALNRVVAKVRDYHRLLTRARQEKLLEQAQAKHPDNHQMALALYTRLVEQECFVSINLLCHSMGNYVFKHTFKTSDNATSSLVFDNVCLVAADTNNAGHAQWVGQLDVRNRVYVVINENDLALQASRIKPGAEQKARLGHFTRELDSANAYYLDLTDADCVGSEHTYFKGDAVGNPALKQLFAAAFAGRAVEGEMAYRPDKNTYHLTLRSSAPRSPE